MASEKVPALRLTLGNAPSSWHVVAGLPGFYHPDIAVPVGGPGEAPLDAAKDAAKDEGCAVKLEQISNDAAAKARAAVADLRTTSVQAVRDLARSGQVDEQIHAEKAAGSGQEN